MKRTGMFSGMAVLMALAVSVPAYADEVYQFVSGWGSPGAADGSFDEPAGIIVGTAGKVIVADSGNDRIQRFSAAGVFEAAYGTGGTDAGQFARPLDVAVNDDGGIFVADTDNDRIQRYDPDESEWKVISTAASPLSKPCGIALAKSNEILIADTGNNVIKKFNHKGELLLTVGSAGSLDGQFQSPTDVAVDSLGNIYVVDSGNHRIQKFSPSGAFIAAWGSYGISGNGFFNSPRSVAIDRQDAIFVTDTLNHRIQKFDGAGNFLAVWGAYGTVNNGEFNQPGGIALDCRGNVLVSDTLNHRIQKFELINTPAGLSVSVCNPLADACVTFSEVTVAGQTSIGWLCALQAPCLPAGQTLLPLGRILSIETTATYTGPVELCLTYEDENLTPVQESELLLKRYDQAAKAWVDLITTVDAVNNKICAETQSLGLFALAYPQTVVKPSVKISPQTLNLKSKGNYITANVRFPACYDARCVDKSSVVISNPTGQTVPAVAKSSGISYSVKEGIWQMMVKFDRSAVGAIVAAPKTTLTVSGVFACNLTGIVFEGSDTIKVIPKDDKKDKSKGKK